MSKLNKVIFIKMYTQSFIYKYHWLIIMIWFLLIRLKNMWLSCLKNFTFHFLSMFLIYIYQDIYYLSLFYLLVYKILCFIDHLKYYPIFCTWTNNLIRIYLHIIFSSKLQVSNIYKYFYVYIFNNFFTNVYKNNFRL